MRILFLTQIVPYPPDAGPKVKTWNVLRYLSDAGHEIFLATFVRPEEEKFLTVLREICTQVFPVPVHRSRLTDEVYWLRSQFKQRPFLVERDDSPNMRQTVLEILTLNEIDAIHADQLTMAQFALPHNQAKREQDHPTLVFDAHNAVWTILERTQQTASWWLKPLLALEGKRIKRYEAALVRAFHHTLVVSEPDREAFLEAISLNDNTQHNLDAKITTIPIAVNTKEISSISRTPNSLNILTLGTLHYPPNADGIRWFFQQVFPLISRKINGVSLTIIGKNPPSDFRKLAEENPGLIQVTGYVPDLTPYLQKAAVVVVPVRVGGGMRVRILEALAWGMPVVTTTMGLEGIEAEPEKDVLVKNTPEEFSQAVIRILQNPSLQESLARNGRLLAETRYDWQRVLAALDAIYPISL